MNNLNLYQIPSEGEGEIMETSEQATIRSNNERNVRINSLVSSTMEEQERVSSVREQILFSAHEGSPFSVPVLPVEICIDHESKGNVSFYVSYVVSKGIWSNTSRFIHTVNGNTGNIIPLWN